MGEVEGLAGVVGGGSRGPGHVCSLGPRLSSSLGPRLARVCGGGGWGK